jgi:hypothetical protein
MAVFWNALAAGGVILVPIFVFWLESMRQARNMHVENQQRLTAIETKLDPLWDWWNGRFDRRSTDSD